MLLPNGLLEIGGLGVQMIPSKVARAKRRRTAIVSRQRAFMSTLSSAYWFPPVCLPCGSW